MSEWPDEKRIEPIGQNGATAEHYVAEALIDMQRSLETLKSAAPECATIIYDIEMNMEKLEGACKWSNE